MVLPENGGWSRLPLQCSLVQPWDGAWRHQFRGDQDDAEQAGNREGVVALRFVAVSRGGGSTIRGLYVARQRYSGSATAIARNLWKIEEEKLETVKINRETRRRFDQMVHA